MPLVTHVPFKILAWQLPSVGTNLPVEGNTDPFAEGEGALIYLLTSSADNTDQISGIDRPKLTMGQVNQPFISASPFESTFSISGPAMLLSHERNAYYAGIDNSIASGGITTPTRFYGQNSYDIDNFISDESTFLADAEAMPQIVVDVPTLILAMLSDKVNIPGMDTSVGDIRTDAMALSSLMTPNEEPFHWAVVDKISLTLDENGLNGDISWRGKMTNQPATVYTSLHTLTGQPLRKSQWFDFTVRYSDTVWDIPGFQSGFQNSVIPTDPESGDGSEGSESSGDETDESQGAPLDGGETNEEGDTNVGTIEGDDFFRYILTIVDITVKSATFNINFEYATPSWIGRSQEPVYFLKNITIDWSISSIFDFTRIHRAPHRSDTYTFEYQKNLAEQFANYIYTQSTYSQNTLFFIITSATIGSLQASATSGIFLSSSPFIQALQEVMNNFINIGLSNVNVGSHINSFITENKVSHSSGLSELTIGGTTTLS